MVADGGLGTPRKLLLLFGTRPEAIKLLPVIRDLRTRPEVVVRLCVTAQHRDMLDQVLAQDDIVPDIDLDLMRPGQSLDTLTARLLTGIGPVLDTEAPDRVIVQGDTATAMVGALAAHYRRIPVSHVEAGLRSGNLHHPWPEEANRRMISALADQHFAPTASAAEALRRENVDPAAIHVTGNTVIDALLWMRARIAAQPSLAAGLDALAGRFTDKRIILVTTHRRENIGEGVEAIARAIGRIATREDVALVLPVHPNPAIRETIARAIGAHDNVALLPPLDYPHFVRLLALASIVLTDSGGVQEEAPALGKPVLVLRETTERPEGVAAGTARLIGAREDRIVAETLRLLDDKAAYAAMAHAHNPYGDGHAAARIGRVLAGEGLVSATDRPAPDARAEAGAVAVEY